MQKIRTGGAAAVVLAAVSCAHAQDAVQWRVEDGGNGHWYAQELDAASWVIARSVCEARGGYLMTFANIDEWNFVRSFLPTSNSLCYFGLIQDVASPKYSEPSGGWTWISGEPLEVWWFSPGEPNNLFGDQNVGQTRTSIDCPECWDDTHGNAALPFLIEWSADCNDDGIVDYGQILDGTYADENGNGVPDCCEGACPGDLNLDDRVDSADLGLLIAAWNTDGSIVAGSDINEDGIVNAADLGLQIGNWGDCGCN
jgi:hypothetical protein